MQKFRAKWTFYVLVCVLCTCVVHTHGQTFSMQSFLLGVFHQLEYGENGAGVSVCDINKDGWDDISFCNSGAFPSIYVNNGNSFDLLDFTAEVPYQIKQVNWVDYDNDGDRDLTFTCYQGPMFVFEQVDNLVFQDVSGQTGLSFDTYETYGASWADYDRDGDLDVYIANYNALYFGDPTIENFLYQNNGDGTFTDVTAAAGVGNGSTYTFSGTWMYANDDLWPDLFISNDRYESSNALYINNGDGTFEDQSQSAGVDFNILSMGVAIDDVDNDGDDDIYVADALENLLLINTNGVFQNMASALNAELNRFSWGTVFLDFNNDGWKDLYVATSIHYPNNGQNQLLLHTSSDFYNITTQSGMVSDNDDSYGAGIGDFNNDGFMDIVSLELAPSYSKIWMNNATDKHWIKANLHGSESNRDGIGARITCYAQNGVQTQVVRCGESYLSQNSLTEQFGLANASRVDSLRVEWPSGTIDKWYQIEVDQVLELHEGHGFLPAISPLSDLAICPGDSCEIIISDETSQLINWSNGSTASVLAANAAGQWSARVQDQYGNIFNSNVLQTTLFESLPLSVEVLQPLCAGHLGHVQLVNFDALIDPAVDAFALASGELDLASGAHTVTWINEQNCHHSHTINIAFPPAITNEVQIEHNTCFGGNNGVIAMSLAGGAAPYTWLLGAEYLSNLSAGEYHYQVEDAVGCPFYDTIFVDQSPQIQIDVQWTPVSCSGGSDGQIEFEVSGGTEPYFVVTSWLNDEELTAGFYAVDVVDDMNCVSTYSFEVEEPQPLMAELTVQNTLDNNATGAAEIVVSGGTAPYSYWWSNGGGNVSSVGQLSANDYQVQVSDAHGCVWNTTFEILEIVGIDETLTNNVLFWPNPVETSLNFHPSITELAIFSLSGQKVLHEKCSNGHIALPQLPAGMYLLKLYTQQGETGSFLLSKD